MQELIDKVIKEIYVNETGLIFITDSDERLYYQVDGGCCSSSYFSEIMHPESILGHRIVKVDALEQESGEPTIQEEDIIYAYRITSDRELGLSNCIVTFRNSSNGYYGGSCGFGGSAPSLDVSKMTKVKSNYVADWRAF